MLKIRPKNDLSHILLCDKCHLSETRKQIVIGRGDMPADVLFIGEAPGRSEDLLGEPFIGQAGKLFEKILYGVRATLKNNFTYYITNTILCRPCSPEDENRPPSPEEVLQCRPNLLSVVKKVNPKKVVFIGKIADLYFRWMFPGALTILHPAYLLRTGGERSPNFILEIKILQNYLKEIL